MDKKIVVLNYVIYNNVTIVLLYFCVQTKEGKIMTKLENIK